MIASRVTPLVKEKGEEVDGAVEAEGIVISDHLERRCASLHLMVARLWHPSHGSGWTWEKGQKNGEEFAW